MLRTNLSTRPFYNIRAVRLALAAAAAIVTAITIFNVVQSIALSAREGELSQTRARVVNTRQLAQVARDLGLAK
jgi:hypothetical protein